MLNVSLTLPALQSSFILTIDRLSAFFILVVNLTVFTGFLYARGYLEPYYEVKNSLAFFHSLFLLSVALFFDDHGRDDPRWIIVPDHVGDHGTYHPSSWSFLMRKTRSIMKTGINYLIQMHVGMFFILIAFLVVEQSNRTDEF